MKKRLLSILLCFMMCLSLLPTAVFAASDYDVWANGEQFTSDKLTINCGSGTAAYDPAKKELTLNNATLEDNGIAAYDALTVNVIGTNSIEMANEAESSGIYAEGDLTLTGSGSLKIEVLNPTCDGIWAEGSLTDAMSGSLTVRAGDDGMIAGNRIALSGGGAVTVTGLNGSGMIADSGDVTRTGNGDLTVNAENKNDAIYAAENVALSGNGDVYVASEGTGIYAGDGDITLSCGGDVTIDCGKNGMDACSDVTIGGTGDVDVVCGGYGIYSDDSEVTLSGKGAVTVTSLNNVAVMFYGTDSKLLLNGTGSPITLTAGEGYKAVLNSSTDTSPVGGEKFANYDVTGAPDRAKVTYTLKSSTPTEPAEITKIEITVPEATAGKTGAEAGTVPTITTVPANAIEMRDGNWWNVSDGNYFTGTFEAGKDYIFGITITPKDGYKISCDGDDYLGEIAVNGGTFQYTEAIGTGIFLAAAVKGEGSAAPVTEYGVWVNGEQFTSDKLTIDCGSGTAAYDPAEKELTLNNATITKVHVGDDEAGAICSYDALTINLKGTNYIALKSSVEGTGIYTSGDLTLVGETLAMVVANEECNGIWTENGDVTVAMGGILSITAGNHGIFASNDLTFSGSGRVTVTGENDCGVVAYYGDVTRTGSGDLKVVCESQDQAIYAHENVDLSGNGDVEIISDGTGICASNGSITLSCDGDVTLDCVKYGLDACSNVTIGGTGDVDVTSGGYGIYADEGLVTLSGSGAVTVTSLNDAAVIFFGADNKLLLNGSASPITLTADEGCKAVLNYSTNTSPVGGNLISYYAVTGAPDTNKVVYTWKNPEQLPMATNLRWDGQTAVWDPVENATYYACLWYENGTHVTTNICYSCEDTTGIAFEDGNKYQFYVRAYNPENYITSEMAPGPEKTFQREQLSMPTNLRWDGQTAVWDPVENATHYFCMWYKNGTFVVANACYDCKDTTGITFEAGNTYQFYVRAYNPENYITSEKAQGPEKTFPADPGPADPCEGYTDINRSSWYHPAADFVISRGLMGSTVTGKLTFEPNLSCTRSMIVTILYSYSGKPAVTFEPRFGDVKEGQWFADPIMWAYQNNIVTGYNDGNFGPNDKVTREQMAVILMAYAKYAGKDVSQAADLSKFADNSKATWSKPYLAWAVAEGLISGKTQGEKTYLDPQGLATRAEVATMIRGFVLNILEA